MGLPRNPPAGYPVTPYGLGNYYSSQVGMTTTRSARIKFKNGFEGTMQLVWEHDKLDGKKYSRRKHFFFHYSDLGT